MSEATTESTYDKEHTVLEAFVLENEELDKLESKLEGFNLFEAIGMVRQEIRHSAFLAFLLDPQRNHGLGDTFATRLLQESLKRARDAGIEFDSKITPLQMALWSLDGIVVYREWNNIDILLVDSVNKLVVIIENKIFTGEHDDQLNRYHQTVKQHYPDYKIIGLYLSPDGKGVEDETQRSYVSIDYGLISTILRDLKAHPDVQIVIDHYIEMLRRHIVNNDIPKLCQEIYRKHKQAIDLIIQYIPDQQAELHEQLIRLIGETQGLEVLAGGSKSVLYFTITEWKIPTLMPSGEWTLYFQIDNEVRRIRVRMMIGPGDDKVRKGLLEMAWNNREIFKPQNRKLGQYNTIAFHELLVAKDFDEIFDTENLAAELSRRWKQFVDGRLEEIVGHVDQQEWLSKTPQQSR